MSISSTPESIASSNCASCWTSDATAVAAALVVALFDCSTEPTAAWLVSGAETRLALPASALGGLRAGGHLLHVARRLLGTDPLVGPVRAVLTLDQLLVEARR